MNRHGRGATKFTTRAGRDSGNRTSIQSAADLAENRADLGADCLDGANDHDCNQRGDQGVSIAVAPDLFARKFLREVRQASARSGSSDDAVYFASIPNSLDRRPRKNRRSADRKRHRGTVVFG